MDRLAQTQTRTMVLPLTRCWLLAGLTAFDSRAALVYTLGQAGAAGPPGRAGWVTFPTMSAP